MKNTLDLYNSEVPSLGEKKKEVDSLRRENSEKLMGWQMINSFLVHFYTLKFLNLPSKWLVIWI
jgi:hypothetical protein